MAAIGRNVHFNTDEERFVATQRVTDVLHDLKKGKQISKWGSNVELFYIYLMHPVCFSMWKGCFGESCTFSLPHKPNSFPFDPGLKQNCHLRFHPNWQAVVCACSASLTEMANCGLPQTNTKGSDLWYTRGWGSMQSQNSFLLVNIQANHGLTLSLNRAHEVVQTLRDYNGFT